MEINLVFLAVLLLTVFKMAEGYKKGMVKEAISFISMLILGIFAILVAAGISNYNGGKIVNVIVCVLLIILLSVAHHFLKLIFFSAKMVAGLPIISSFNKFLGIFFGILEVVVIMWIVYILTMMFDLGAIGQFILSNTQENAVLRFLYNHNYLAYAIVEFVLSKPIFNKI